MKKTFTDRIVQGTIVFLVRTLLRPKVYYPKRMKLHEVVTEPSIFVANHTGHLDGPVITVMFRSLSIHNLAAKDRFEQENFGFFLRHSGCIPIDRNNPDLSWIHKSIETLRVDKESVAIYPEGRHGTHRQQLPFHSGVTMLAALASVPIVMVYLDGPFKVFGKRARLMISEPFRLDPPSEGMNIDYVNAQTRLLQDRMKSLMEEFISTVG